MAVSDGLIEHMSEVLSPLGRITARRMFSGAGIYCDGVIFALHLRDALYLKADAASKPLFEAEGLGPFTYDTKHGERRITSYWRAPERLFDEPDEFVEWGRRALAVSRAASVKSPARKTSSRPKRVARRAKQ